MTEPTWTDVASFIVAALSLAVTGAGVFVAVKHLKAAAEATRSSFEDSLNREYRDIIATLPAGVMLGEPLRSVELDDWLDEFYRYFDLCNEQAWLADEGRVSRATWSNWQEGIEANLKLPAFQQAWTEIGPKVEFDALRAEFPTLKRDTPQRLPHAKDHDAGA